LSGPQTTLRRLKPLAARLVPLIVMIALLVGCGPNGPPPISHAEAVQLAESEVADWMGQYLNTGYGERSPGAVCPRRLTASSFQCDDQVYLPTRPEVKYAYFVMTVGIGPADALPDAKYLAYSNTTRVIQQSSMSGGPILWLPAGTSAGHYTGKLRHFDVGPGP
jgi:hypothetical protein